MGINQFLFELVHHVVGSEPNLLSKAIETVLGKLVIVILIYRNSKPPIQFMNQTQELRLIGQPFGKVVGGDLTRQ